jgi:exonuclease III
MQEVTHPSLDNLNGYTVHYNIGTSQRGTAIVARDNIELSNIRMPSGRAIVAQFKGIWLVNIYAPSGAAKRNEREQFFNTELTYILRAAEFKGIWLVNIYAPSGAAKRNEREQFFNTELTYILRAAEFKGI